MQADYDQCLERVLKYEGGYTDDPQDPGGPTNWGITIFDARMYWKKDASAADVRAMPLSVAKEIYKSKYWDKVHGDDLPAGVDHSVFDYAVNSGLGRAIPALQRVVGVTPDGEIGPQTLAAVQAMDKRQLILDYNASRLRFLQSLRTWSHFGRGWGSRVADVKEFSLHLAAAA